VTRLALLQGVLSGLVLGVPVHPVQGQLPAPADSAYRSALVSLRDSVGQIRIELNTFQRDLSLAGPETVVGRAAALHRRCKGLVATAQTFAPVLRAPRAREATDEIVAALSRVQRGLTEHCVRGLSPDGAGSRPDTLRAWGPHRVAQIERLLADYDRAAQRFARAVGVRLEERPRR
jgi:hypothetical protein